MLFRSRLASNALPVIPSQRHSPLLSLPLCGGLYDMLLHQITRLVIFFPFALLSFTELDAASGSSDPLCDACDKVPIVPNEGGLYIIGPVAAAEKTL